MFPIQCPARHDALPFSCGLSAAVGFGQSAHGQCLGECGRGVAGAHASRDGEHRELHRAPTSVASVAHGLAGRGFAGRGRRCAANPLPQSAGRSLAPGRQRWGEPRCCRSPVALGWGGECRRLGAVGLCAHLGFCAGRCAGRALPPRRGGAAPVGSGRTAYRGRDALLHRLVGRVAAQLFRHGRGRSLLYAVGHGRLLHPGSGSSSPCDSSPAACLGRSDCGHQAP